MNLELFKTASDGKFRLCWAPHKVENFVKTDAHGVDALILTKKLN